MRFESSWLFLFWNEDRTGKGPVGKRATASSHCLLSYPSSVDTSNTLFSLILRKIRMSLIAKRHVPALAVKLSQLPPEHKEPQIKDDTLSKYLAEVESKKAKEANRRTLFKARFLAPKKAVAKEKKKEKVRKSPTLVKEAAMNNLCTELTPRFDSMLRKFSRRGIPESEAAKKAERYVEQRIALEMAALEDLWPGNCDEVAVPEQKDGDGSKGSD